MLGENWGIVGCNWDLVSAWLGFGMDFLWLLNCFWYGFEGVEEVVVVAITEPQWWWGRRIGVSQLNKSEGVTCPACEASPSKILPP